MDRKQTEKLEIDQWKGNRPTGRSGEGQETEPTVLKTD
jgi:hypothetical protein